MTKLGARGGDGLRHAWYVLARSRDLTRGQVLRRVLFGRPLAVFRGASGAVGVLADACPHRRHPLSAGKVLGDQLRCGYHGWRFGRSGACELVPGLDPSRRQVKPGCAPHHATVEQDGLVWVWGVANEAPEGRPLALPLARAPGYAMELLDLGVFKASVDVILDNFMDSSHPAFVHEGLLNSDTRRFLIDLEIRDCSERDEEATWPGLECAYRNEPYGDFSWFIKLFGSRSGASEISHFERYFPPSIHQFEYRMGSHHFVSTQFLTPEDDTATRLTVAWHFDFGRVPHTLARWPLRALITLLLRQDQRLLERLQQNHQAFPDAPEASTALDAFGRLVLRHRRQVAAGTAPLAPHTKPLDLSAHL